MSQFFNAFELGPTVERGPAAVAPEVFRGIYAMPAFVTVETSDLKASTAFWTRGLGFIELFGIPGQIVHLRRWAFQDVLLVAANADSATESAATTAARAAMSVSFSCVLEQLDGIVAACRDLVAGSATEPCDTPWGTRDVEIMTPERVRVVCTAPLPFDPEGQVAHDLAAVGIFAPDTPSGGDNGAHG
ncbi:VOC family protein [Agromyces soli]